MVGRCVRAKAFETRRRSVLEMAIGRTPSCFLGIPMRMAEERNGEWSRGRRLEAAAKMKEERVDRNFITSAGLFGKWRASLRWAGRRPVGPGEECEGKERISFRMVSGVRP